MKRVPLPHIRENDYHMFWRMLLPVLPSRYQDWLDRMQAEGDQHAKRGVAIGEVAISPREFSQYCHSRSGEYGIDNLFFLAGEKARRSASFSHAPDYAAAA